MELKEYFETVKGTGVLATADSNRKVDVAIYGRPHVMENGTVAFITADQLSHENLRSNPYAAYIFVEAGEGYKGKRLYLTKVKEETDPRRIAALRRRPMPAGCHSSDGDQRFLVHFRLDRVRPLVGDEPE
jgi:hypothetical protein